MQRKHNAGKRVVIYLRVSTSEQLKDSAYGVDAQLAACMKYVGERGYTVVAIESDLGVSGTATNRAGLEAALTRGDKKQADVILAYAQDRFARKVGLFDDIRERARKHGYRLETARDGQDLTTEENELPADVMSFVASLERKLITKRLYGGRREKAKVDGRGSGPIPWGYKLVGGVVEVDQEAANVIRQLLTLRDTFTYRETVIELNRRGLKTQKGSEWTISHVQKIERHRELYTTGVRVWDGLEAGEKWPIIIG